MLSPGVRIRGYTIGERIGSSQLGEVYRGRDLSGRPVAVKLLHGTAQDFAEARAVAVLNHPNIVPLLDVFEHDGRLCLVQPWMEGGSLQSELDRRGLLGTAATVRVGRDIAAALAHAHGRGIVHRDLKPSNVLRDREGSYRLADFGAVGRLEPGTGTTRAGQIAGTPLYMSPEQITGARQGPASDLFGLGLLLFRCEYGRLPAEASGGVFDVLRQRVSVPIDVPESPLRDLIAQCLELDAARRPASATDVLGRLDALAPVVGGPPLPGASVPPHVEPAAPVLLPDLTARAERPGARGAVFTVVLSVVVVAVFVAVFVGVVALGNYQAQPGASPGGGWTRLALGAAGFVVAGLSIALAVWLRARWSVPPPQAERAAANILFGAATRTDLTASLMIEVDQLIARLNSLDGKILGMTVVAMVREYEGGRTSSDRQAALLNVVTLMEKLQARLSPWHIRHRESLTLGIAIVGCLTGVTSALGPFLA